MRDALKLVKVFGYRDKAEKPASNDPLTALERLQHKMHSSAFDKWLNDIRLEKINAFYNNERDVTTDKDNEETPEAVFRLIERVWGVRKELLFDLCPYVKAWTRKRHFDFMNETIPLCLNYANVPFSITVVALAWFLCMWICGRNIIALFPKRYLDKPFVKTFILPCTVNIDLGTMTFKGNRDPLNA